MRFFFHLFAAHGVQMMRLSCLFKMRSRAPGMSCTICFFRFFAFCRYMLQRGSHHIVSLGADVLGPKQRNSGGRRPDSLLGIEKSDPYSRRQREDANDNKVAPPACDGRLGAIRSLVRGGERDLFRPFSCPLLHHFKESGKRSLSVYFVHKKLLSWCVSVFGSAIKVQTVIGWFALYCPTRTSKRHSQHFFMPSQFLRVRRLKPRSERAGKANASPECRKKKVTPTRCYHSKTCDKNMFWGADNWRPSPATGT